MRYTNFSLAQNIGQSRTNIDPNRLEPIPPGTIVVRRAPQIEILKRAALCITHAGLNTTLESLAQGVPMVAIPIAFDQPGTSARIAHHGVGEIVDLDDLSVDNLVEIVRKMLTNRSYAERAHYFKEVIGKTCGLDIAADVIEQAFQKASTER
jgi:zeaxanthin glucosyltransferase